MPRAADFECAVLPHLDAAHNLARWLVRDAVLAEDVVQDAVLRALGYFASYRGGDARAWLLRIVRHTAYDTLAARKRSAAGPLDDADGVHDGDDPEAALSRREGVGLIERALAALPLELRECLVLREMDELSYKDISHVVGVPIGTVMSRLWRARRAVAPRRDGDVS